MVCKKQKNQDPKSSSLQPNKLKEINLSLSNQTSLPTTTTTTIKPYFSTKKTFKKNLHLHSNPKLKIYHPSVDSHTVFQHIDLYHLIINQRCLQILRLCRVLTIRLIYWRNRWFFFGCIRYCSRCCSYGRRYGHGHDFRCRCRCRCFRCRRRCRLLQRHRLLGRFLRGCYYYCRCYLHCRHVVDPHYHIIIMFIIIMLSISLSLLLLLFLRYCYFL